MLKATFAWFALLASTAAFGDEEWPQFRGPGGQGTSIATNTPVEWGEDRNIRWKTSLPGSGNSSPVIGSNQIWMTAATDQGRSLRAFCVDRSSGRMVFDVEVFRRGAPDVISEPLNGHASPTPVLDRDRVYVSFGPNGIACVSRGTGEIVWRNIQLVYQHDRKGVGSSPILHEHLLILNCDGMDQSYVAALDKRTGRLAWKTRRSKAIPMGGMSYSTPLLLHSSKKDCLVSAGAYRVSGYDPASGREEWFCDLPGNNMVPSPVWGYRSVFVGTGGTKPEIWAIAVDAPPPAGSGQILWKSRRQTPAVSSPLIAESRLYWVSDGGVVCCTDAQTGRELWTARIGGRHFASPVLVEGRIYFFDQDGKTVVVRATSNPSLLATNKLAGRFLASAALAGNAFYLRSTTHLYRVEKTGEPPRPRAR